ncbi:MAG: PhoPQ-activated protein PqaA family protein, partial [Thermoanaerobaculia bacterium]|nr:PhoPQ-activated protein PqaA family protein [Thermoanaerobaculia bacterium]
MRKTLSSSTAILATLVVSFAAGAAETALDRYVRKPDDSYRWELARTLEGEHEGRAYTAWVLELTSQTWRPGYEVDRPVWKHWLTITRPEGADRRRALLYIGGGRNGEAPPGAVDERSARMAVGTGSVVADLGQVPNQPLHFADSRGHARFEDDLIAYSRVKYMVTGDEEWLVRL